MSGQWHPIAGGKGISAIIYDKKGKPICYRCGGYLTSLAEDPPYTCPHCDNRKCLYCGKAVVYSSSLEKFLCFNSECSHYCFGAKR